MCAELPFEWNVAYKQNPLHSGLSSVYKGFHKKYAKIDPPIRAVWLAIKYTLISSPRSQKALHADVCNGVIFDADLKCKALKWGRVSAWNSCQDM